MTEETKKYEEVEKEVQDVEADLNSETESKEIEPTVDEIEEAVDLSEGSETIEEDELTQLKNENEALENRALRLQAEIANMQRTSAKERQDSAKYRSQKLATSLLEVVDNLERALQTETVSEDALALKKGVEMVLTQFKNAFERENISVIDPLGEHFDPNYHQAVSVMPAEEGQASDTVINVLQKGYQLHERVIRPAMVIVSQ